MQTKERLDRSKQTNPMIKKGDEFMQKNMPKEAVSEYLKSMLKESDNINSHLGASKAYKELKEYDKAIKHLEKAKKMASFDYEIYYELGLNHLLNTDFELATKNFRKTKKTNKQKPSPEREGFFCISFSFFLHRFVFGRRTHRRS